MCAASFRDPTAGMPKSPGWWRKSRVDAVFFFLDPLGKHPHDPDIQGLLRICNVHNVPLATNIATAVLLINA